MNQYDRGTIRTAYEILYGCTISQEIAKHLDIPTVEACAKRLNDMLPPYERETLVPRLDMARELVKEAWRLLDGQDPKTAEWHLAASQYLNNGDGQPFELLPAVREALNELIEGATQCEDDDVDIDFADQVALLLACGREQVVDEREKFEAELQISDGVYFDREGNQYRSMNGRAVERSDAIDATLRWHGWQARARFGRGPVAEPVEPVALEPSLPMVLVTRYLLDSLVRFCEHHQAAILLEQLRPVLENPAAALPRIEPGTVVCKGALALGSGCGNCYRCQAEEAAAKLEAQPAAWDIFYADDGQFHAHLRDEKHLHLYQNEHYRIEPLFRGRP